MGPSRPTVLMKNHYYFCTGLYRVETKCSAIPSRVLISVIHLHLIIHPASRAYHHTSAKLAKHVQNRLAVAKKNTYDITSRWGCICTDHISAT